MVEDYDLVVVSETEPELRERLIGDLTDDLIDRSPKPVLVVRTGDL
ncbi:universal stress protein [Halalkalicoccus subterraneus]|nr:universal stress protein [Halalkalicoccus subterraneus]